MDEGLVTAAVSALLGGGLFTGVLETVRYFRREPVETHTATVASLDTANSALDRTIDALASRIEDLEGDVQLLKQDRAEDRAYILRVVPVVVQYVPEAHQPEPPRWYYRM